MDILTTLQEHYVVVIVVLILGMIYYLYFRSPKKIKHISKNEASKLYKLVHKKMLKGMDSDEFDEISKKYDDSGMLYLELQQLYNIADDKEVSVADYKRVMDKVRNGDSD